MALSIVIPVRAPLRKLVKSFDHTMSGAIDFGVLSNGDSIIGVQLVIDTAFNDPDTLISLGLVSNPDGILSTADVDPSAVSTYADMANFLVSSADMLRLKVFPMSSTQGTGRVVALVG